MAFFSMIIINMDIFLREILMKEIHIPKLNKEITEYFFNILDLFSKCEGLPSNNQNLSFDYIEYKIKKVIHIDFINKITLKTLNIVILVY